jgi:hypothetical protein
VKKQVVALCIAGLGNRICCFVTGLYLAKLLNYDFKFVWETDAECMCEFDDLFSSYNSHRILYTELATTIEQYSSSRTCFYNPYKRHIYNEGTFLGWERDYKNQKILECLLSLPINNWYQTSTGIQYHNIIADNDLIFYFNPGYPGFIIKQEIINNLQELKLNSNVFTSIEKFIKDQNINHLTSGISIRKHNGANIAKQFTVNIGEVNKLINDNHNNAFFVMSDNKLYENYFSKIPNVLVYPTRSYPYWDSENTRWVRDKEAVIDAFISLLILSRTNILTSTINKENFTSSFLSLGYLYQNIDLKNLKG